jgi:hypothetical protein
MIGEYFTAGAAAIAIASAGWGGYQTIKAQGAVLEMERAQTSEAKALGALETCANRLTNIQEAAASNASIPDNLTDFDIPPEWMLGEPAAGADAPAD